MNTQKFQFCVKGNSHFGEVNKRKNDWIYENVSFFSDNLYLKCTKSPDKTLEGQIEDGQCLIKSA